MLTRMVWVGGLLLLIPMAGQAGIYNTADADSDSMLSTSFDVFLQKSLMPWQTVPEPKPESKPAVYQRYVLIEALGQKGALNLTTVEQKLNYSAVLIRRGKADEAVQLLEPVWRENQGNFLLTSQLASACFFSENFKSNANDYMRQALQTWPTQFEKLDKEDPDHALAYRFLGSGEFERRRKYEGYLQRLIQHRVREFNAIKAKKTPPEGLDPIFVDAETKEPVKFLAEDGKFVAGRIALAEKRKLPNDAIEIVEQLLIWMPHDQRLLWLLGEVFNADATDLKNPQARNERIKDAHTIFSRLTDPLRSMQYAREMVKHRHEVLGAAVKELPPTDIKMDLNLDTKPGTDAGLGNEQMLRTLVVGFVTGFAVGIFAVWQYRELRRRRAHRA